MTNGSRFERYVAIGDSSTEGLDDPDGHGGYRGWANRLAQRIADAQGAVLYANLGIRGRLTREILDTQLAPAIAMNPDLATLFSGSNDILRLRFDARQVEHDVAHMQRSLAERGATVVTFTLPDLTPILPMARVLAPRVRAMNDALRSASASTGAILVDFAAHAIGSDARLWSEDRFHANSDGHVRIANALAQAIGIPGADDSWMHPLPPVEPQSRSAQWGSQIAWGGRRLRGLGLALARGGAKVDRKPKRPRLEWVHRAADERPRPDGT